MLVDLEADRLEAAKADLRPDRITTFIADVSDQVGVRGLRRGSLRKVGCDRRSVSIADNHGNIGLLESYDEEAFDRTYRIHVKGAFLACKYCARCMRDGGSIIVTSRVAGLHGGDGAGLNVAYSTFKQAQTGLVRAAAGALAPRGIRVNSLIPGPSDNAFQTEIETRLNELSGGDLTAALNTAIPLGRHANVDEVANVALFLASSMSGFVMGHVHVGDGGLGS